MIRQPTISAAAVLLVLALASCGDGGDSGAAPDSAPSPLNASTATVVTPVVRPASVPATAEAILETEQLGTIVRSAGEAPGQIGTRELVNAGCEGSVLALETSAETIYAALPCDRFFDRETAATFEGEQVAITLEAGESRFRVLIETLGGAEAQFTVSGIWVD